MGNNIKGLNPLLSYVSDLLSIFQIKPILEPAKYRDKVLTVKEILKNDVSGLVGTTLDLAIGALSGVQYRVTTDNEGLTKTLNQWLENINESLRGRIPTGLNSLSKEYGRERWKGSSNLLLRTFWEDVDGIELPTVMFFVDGEDIVVKEPENGVIELGTEQYALRVSSDEDDDIKLPKNDTEEIFVQTPYEAWGTVQPQPYLMRRGLWHNLQFMKLLSEKGEFVVARALEYLLLIKKGTEKLYLEGNISYSKEDLEKVSRDFQDLLAKKKYEMPNVNGMPTGSPTYATQFDTSMEHVIPDYSKILHETLYRPIERKLLSGLGLIDVFESGGSERRKEKLNAAPFMSEVRQGILDFQRMLHDIMKTIVEKSGKPSWRKAKITITNSPIQEFLSDDGKSLLRSLYDRGLLSRETTVTLLGEADFNTEVHRLEDEKKKGIDETMFPPVITNIDEQFGSAAAPGKVKNPADPDNPRKVSEDKSGPEAKNYNNASTHKTKNKE